jgi:hypothetical protein
MDVGLHLGGVPSGALMRFNARHPAYRAHRDTAYLANTSNSANHNANDPADRHKLLLPDLHLQWVWTVRMADGV